jgi:hypothetical protein
MVARCGPGAVVRAECQGNNPLWELAQHTTKSGALKTVYRTSRAEAIAAHASGGHRIIRPDPLGAAVTVLDIEKLARVLGMLGSNNSNEVLVAAAQAERLRREAGLTWQDVLSPPPLAPQTVVQVDDAIDVVFGRVDLLSEWERRFVGSISRARYPLSDRQVEVLGRIVEKVRRAGPRAAA